MQAGSPVVGTNLERRQENRPAEAASGKKTHFPDFPLSEYFPDTLAMPSRASRRGKRADFA
jgi:hypothetical protein